MKYRRHPPAGINEGFSDPQKLAHYVRHFARPERILYRARHEIVNRCGLHADMVVADIGAGTGEMARLVAPHVRAVLAVEIFPHFVEHIRSRMEREKRTNVEVRLATTSHLGLTPASIDLALLCNTYHHVEFPEILLPQLHSALRTEGTVVLVELNPDPDPSAPGNHVRGDRAAFCREFERAGFRRESPGPEFMEGAYLDRFHKLRS